MKYAGVRSDICTLSGVSMTTEEVVRAMKKKSKGHQKQYTESEKVSAIQELDRGLMSKRCKNFCRSLKKKVLFPVRKGVQKYHVFAQREGVFLSRDFEAKVQSSWTWLSFSVLFPKSQGWNTLALKIHPTPCDQESGMVSCVVLSVKGGTGDPAKWVLFTVCCF